MNSTIKRKREKERYGKERCSIEKKAERKRDRELLSVVFKYSANVRTWNRIVRSGD